MTESLTSKIRDHINRNGPSTPKAITEAIPELAECGGEDRALLLMRLDPKLEPAQNKRWALRGILEKEKGKIVHESASKRFQTLNRPGTPLNSMVQFVCKETGLDKKEVREELDKYYTIHGTNIFNRSNKQENR